MQDEQWLKTLEDGRRVRFIYEELPDDGAFMTAQIAGNEVVYSVLMAKAGNPLTRQDVESHFEAELAKKGPPTCERACCAKGDCTASNFKASLVHVA